MGMVLYMQVTEKNVGNAITVHHGSTDSNLTTASWTSCYLSYILKDKIHQMGRRYSTQTLSDVCEDKGKRT